MTTSESISTQEDGLQVPFSRISTFIRQITHDVRNSLNALDLQTAYILEIASDPEVNEELKRMRSQIHLAARAMQSLSANFWTAPPSQIAYAANIFIEDFRDRLLKIYPDKAKAIVWNTNLGNEEVSVDIEMIFSAIAEFFKNAFQFAEPGMQISVTSSVSGGQFHFIIEESKKAVSADPATWGLEPFVSTRRGSYGLGLFRTRTTIAAHSGTLQFTHDPENALLKTQVSLPLAG